MVVLVTGSGIISSFSKLGAQAPYRVGHEVRPHHETPWHYCIQVTASAFHTIQAGAESDRTK